MGENRLMIPAAILMACFVLWGIFYTSRTRTSNQSDENNHQENERIRPRDSNDNLYFDYLDNYENRESIDFDYLDNTEFDYWKEMESISEIPGIESPVIDIPDQIIDSGSNQTTDPLQQKVDNCLLIEEQRYRGILNTYLNPDSSYYVGIFNFLDYWKKYEEEHEKEKSRCYQLYFQ